MCRGNSTCWAGRNKKSIIVLKSKEPAEQEEKEEEEEEEEEEEQKNVYDWGYWELIICPWEQHLQQPGSLRVSFWGLYK